MDPLSIITTIQSLIQKADAIYEVVQKFRNADDAYTAFVKELETARLVLSAVKTYLDTTPSDAALPLAQIQEGTVGLGKSMAKVEAKFRGLDESLFKRSLFVWKGDDDLTAVRDDLQRFNIVTSLLTGVATGLKINAIRATQLAAQNETSAIRATQLINQIETTAQRAKEDAGAIARRQEETRQSIVTWFNAVDPTKRHEDYRYLREDGTCEWLPRTEQFRNWFNTPGSFLWINGIPGSGKSVLASATIEHVRASNVTAYFYCTFSEERTVEASAVLQSVLSQLIRKLDGHTLESELGFLIQKVKDGASPIRRLPELVERIYWVCKAGRWERVFIILDALDELPVNNREALLEHLAVLASNSPRGCINLLVTSREEQDISEIFRSGNVRVLRLTGTRAVSQDMELFVTNALSRRRKFRRLTAEVKTKITELLLQMGSGMFRWVDLQLTQLEKHALTNLTPHEIEKVLANLPVDIFATYRAILVDLICENPKASIIVRRALHILVGAFRPLKLSEVVEAVAIEPGERQLNEEMRLEQETNLLEACSSLVSYDKAHRTISLSHFTVQEFLLSRDLLHEKEDLLKEHAIVSLPTLQCHLASAITTYLTLQDFDPEAIGTNLLDICTSLKLVTPHPFLPYAAVFWKQHADAAGTIEDQTDGPKDCWGGRSLWERLLAIYMDLIKWTRPAEDAKLVQHEALRAQRQIGTCEWLGKTDEFQWWISTPASFLWIYGVPGSGKSVMTSSIIDYLRQSHQRCIFFYCFSLDDRRDDGVNILRGLLAQMLVQLDVLDVLWVFNDLIQAMHSKPGQDDSDAYFASLKCTDIIGLLYRACSVLPHGERMYVIIDGIDETVAEGRSVLTCGLASMASGSPQGCISVLITSRRTADIAMVFEANSARGVDLDQRTSTNGSDDVATYIKLQLDNRLRAFVQLPDVVKEEIAAEVTQRANGMFLVARLALEILEEHASSVSEIRIALGCIPDGLYSTYQHILENAERTAPGKALIIQRAIRCVIGSGQPLTLAELVEGVTIDPKMRVHDIAPPDAVDVLDWCSDLVSYDVDEDEVRLTCFTEQLASLPVHSMWKVDEMKEEAEVIMSLMKEKTDDSVKIVAGNPTEAMSKR